MKITIDEVKRSDKPFDLKNGGKGYSYAVTLQGSEEVVKVMCFTDKLEVKPGAVFETGVNVKDIKKERKDGYQGAADYTQYTLWALPKTNTFSKGGGFVKINMDKFKYAVQYCWDEVETKMPNESMEIKLKYFDILLNNMLDHVEFETGAEKIEKTLGENPFADENIPF